MFHSTAKIGYACKTVVPDPKHGFLNIPELNFRGTTATWIRNHPAEAEQKLWEITEHNCNALLKMVEHVGGLDEHLRMVRIGSDIWPLATHPEVQFFWSKQSVRDMAGKILELVGDVSRSHGVRLSMHPGQFVVLASDNEDIVSRSIEEFEYHVDVARLMGFGSSWHDHGFKINVHISGRRGPDGFRETLWRLSPEARNLITVENEENSHGLDSVLDLSDVVSVVLDLHHNWVREGEYIRRTDDRVKRVIDSWRDVRPVLHYSVSREDVLVNHDANLLPDREALIASGINKQKLRAHSDMMWNSAVNDWALSFADSFDIMVEAKGKNLAAHALAKQLYGE